MVHERVLLRKVKYEERGNKEAKLEGRCRERA